MPLASVGPARRRVPFPTGVGGDGAAQPCEGRGGAHEKKENYRKKNNAWSRKPWHCRSSARSRRADGNRCGAGTGLNGALVDCGWSIINLREVCVCIRAPLNSVC